MNRRAKALKRLLRDRKGKPTRRERLLRRTELALAGPKERVYAFDLETFARGSVVAPHVPSIELSIMNLLIGGVKSDHVADFMDTWNLLSVTIDKSMVDGCVKIDITHNSKTKSSFMFSEEKLVNYKG